MKLHSDTLTVADVYAAAHFARSRGHDIHIDAAILQGSRTRKHGITFYAESMDGTRKRNGREGYAATWTAYGWLIAELFNRDPHAVFDYYKSPQHFREECERAAKYRGDSIDFLAHLGEPAGV